MVRHVRGAFVRRSALVLCVLGFIFLTVGTVLAVPPVRSVFFSLTIHTSGQIAYPDGASQQVSGVTSLDLLGYVVVFISLWFFAIAFVWNKKLA